MRLLAVLRILGVFMALHSLGMLPPLILSLIYDDGQYRDFLYPMLFTLAVGVALWVLLQQQQKELRRHEGFLIVALFWLVLSAVSALPLVMGPHLDFAEAFFEATSAFTTTGATVMTGLDALPRSVLFYRQELQWFGGIGIIVITIALLPLLGIGGMQLFRAETPGPMKDEKLTPRIAHTARIFSLIYLGLTVSCIVGYLLAGMSTFDAVVHSFSTLSTGGFATHDSSMAYHKSLAVEIITEVFMLLGAMNFSIHFLAMRQRSLRAYIANAEVATFLLIVAGVIALITLVLTLSHTYASVFTALRHASFTTISVITSTGYTTEDFSVWPTFVPVLLILISFIGGCSGSTAGGMKVIRVMLLFKQGYHEILQLIHPKVVRPIRISGQVFSSDVLSGVWGFFALYVAIFCIAMLVLMAGGLDQITAFSAVATCINNMGPGLGEVSVNFKSIADWQKLILALCMLLGRLEIFTLIVLFMPSFWRR